MKSVYPLLFTVCISVTVILPRAAMAQCTCTGGLPATSVTQLVYVDTTTASSSLITFNKFTDTSTNTPHEALTCMTIQDTMSVVASNAATNVGVSGTSNTQFTLNVNYTISGPGNLYGYQNSAKNYGPYNFAPGGQPGDSVMLGPDTLFNNVATTLSSTGAPPFNPGPYQGTGTVSDTVAFGGGTTSSSGNNFAYLENAKYWGVFRITYYWCPMVALATTISVFTATRDGNYVILKWTTDNEQNNTNYEIQFSTNGQSFTSLGETESNPATAGAAAKYQYQYNLDQAAVGNLYFRIKETDATGKVTYSEVLVVSPGGANAGDKGPISYQTYPNPATNSLVFQFNSGQTGRYLVELVSTAGQVVQQKSVTLTGTSQIRLDLNPHPAKGLYFLRTTDLTHNQEYVSKVFID